MEQVTLGGDRLGSGKKMKIGLHSYERSTHDMSYLWRSTMAAGTLVPFMKQVALPGDTWDIELNCDIKTHPTIGPLFGSYKVQLDVFLAPLRLYVGRLLNNELGVGLDMAGMKLPFFELEPNVMVGDFADLSAAERDNADMNTSCLLRYLGISGVGLNWPTSTEGRRFNAVPFLAYWDIFKNYYSNKSEDKAFVIHTPQEALVETVDVLQIKPNSVLPLDTIPEAPTTGSTFGTGNTGTWELLYITTPPKLEQIIVTTTDGINYGLNDLLLNPIDDGVFKITGAFNFAQYGSLKFNNWHYITPAEAPFVEPQLQDFNLTLIDDMKRQILATAIGNNALQVGVAGADLAPYKYVLGKTDDFQHRMSTQEGLAVKTYQSDLFNNWMNTEWIDGAGGINDITAIDTSGGSFNIDTLQLSKKVYDMLNRVAISGGSYNDWMKAVYTGVDRAWQPENPVYLGGLIKELVFQEVVSNSGASSADEQPQPLGTLAGKGILAQKHKGGKITARVNEISYLIGIISLTPRVDYSQGNDWDTHLLTMDDFFKPALQQIGFQELITEQMAWFSTARATADGEFITKSAGKQPAWLNYMTNVNKVYGNFADPNNEMFMTLNRKYEGDDTTGAISDMTTYIDPKKFNNIFAQTSRDAQNFWTQIAVDAFARRLMSAKLMPNL